MIRLLAGDCRGVLATLPADGVQCVVTSPPYYGLRDYGTAQWDGGDAVCDHKPAVVRTPMARNDDGQAFRNSTRYRDHEADGAFGRKCGKCGAVRVDRQIGLEPTPDEYLATMVAVFREVRRVLRPDGTCWVNMGDSYAGNTESNGRSHNVNAGASGNRAGADERKQGIRVGGKPKDLLMMPARLALALQADGWWLRSAITWCKPSPMPESCTDRPTSATEMVYLLTKRAHYFYDAIAIREDAVSDHPSGNGYKRDARLSYADDNGARGNEKQWNGIGGTRNARNWWVINSKPFPEAHFATFPPALAERCIKAGTSERGCCSQCKASNGYEGRRSAPLWAVGGGGGKKKKKKKNGSLKKKKNKKTRKKQKKKLKNKNKNKKKNKKKTKNTKKKKRKKT